MARRKYRKTRRYSPRRLRRSYRKKRTIPLAPTIGLLGGAALAAPYYTPNSPVTLLKRGDLDGAARTAITNLTGIYIVGASAGGGVRFDVARALNPFDLSAGAAWKMALLGGIIHKVANMAGVNRHMSSLPSPLNKLRV